MDVRIGIVQTVKELEVELEEDANRDEVMKRVEAAMAAESVLWLTDRKGRQVAVLGSKIAYIELGAPASARSVGFGAP